jgi:sodium/potassium-transporting ATPase subunit alpha
LYTIPAAICALILGIFFSAVPWFQKVFQTRLVPVEFIFIPMTFGIGLFL